SPCLKERVMVSPASLYVPSMIMSPPVTFILPSLKNSTTAPTPTVPSSALVTSHLPTKSLALSAFLSSAPANEAPRQRTIPTASIRAAFIALSLFLAGQFDGAAFRVGDAQGRRVQLVDGDLLRLVLVGVLASHADLVAVELVGRLEHLFLAVAL